MEERLRRDSIVSTVVDSEHLPDLLEKFHLTLRFHISFREAKKVH